MPQQSPMLCCAGPCCGGPICCSKAAQPRSEESSSKMADRRQQGGARRVSGLSLLAAVSRCGALPSSTNLQRTRQRTRPCGVITSALPGPASEPHRSSAASVADAATAQSLAAGCAAWPKLRASCFHVQLEMLRQKRNMLRTRSEEVRLEGAARRAPRGVSWPQAAGMVFFRH